MHTLATNVLMWMSVVLDESMKQLQEIYDAHETESPWPGHGEGPQGGGLDPWRGGGQCPFPPHGPPRCVPHGPGQTELHWGQPSQGALGRGLYTHPDQ